MGRARTNSKKGIVLFDPVDFMQSADRCSSLADYAAVVCLKKRSFRSLSMTKSLQVALEPPVKRQNGLNAPRSRKGITLFDSQEFTLATGKRLPRKRSFVKQPMSTPKTTKLSVESVAYDFHSFNPTQAEAVVVDDEESALRGECYSWSDIAADVEDIPMLEEEPMAFKFYAKEILL
ncbi:unnamed protein product [Aphanomyces euteiches]|uniref:Uncharacterized protein n=1 Tax=Aphanomyces euteiches TaxID=100861 RepID=A0A6G0XJB2_9STRA|nr:hypothetical protein Ae201684_004124 [Aphanomyces euteiches]KAH9094386.1 hypothetical protein Ae201684P_016994 [Aphanomyces euteiches]KAH9143339.1 hypothetical protein AeRB84_012656 [Aphanomyces euteiches]